jgi:Mesyanzhinovviridae bifunctional DNA primase/polymerase
MIDAQPFRESGWQLIPLHRWDDRAGDGRELGKAPRDADWTRREYPDAEVDSAIASGRNVGARPHALQLVVDYDPRNDPTGSGLAGLKALMGAAFTAAPTVRTGSGGLHLYLRLPGGDRLRNSVDELPGVEMKGRGRQVLVPGCRHPNGNYYAWAPFSAELADAPPAPEALLEKFRRPAAAAHSGDVVAELSPEQLRIALAKLDVLDYQDHDRWLALGMACWAAVAGDPGGMAAFIEWSTGDPKYADHAAAIEMRWATWAPKEGEAAIGVGTLFAELPDTRGMFTHLVDELPPIEAGFSLPEGGWDASAGGGPGGIEAHPNFAMLEAKHAIVENVGGRSYVVEELFRPGVGSHELTFSGFAQFRERYAHLSIPVGSGKDEEDVPAAVLWLSCTRKRFRCLEFAPRDLGPDVFNTWRGFAVEEDEEADCTLYFRHLRDVACGGDEECFEWLKGWMAHAVQRPEEPSEVAVVLRGGMGVGKGLIWHYFGRLFGRHSLQLVNPEHVVGRFNKHLMDKVFIFADETFAAGNRAHEQILKGLVTEKTIFVEPKGIDGFPAARYFRMALASNEDWCVPVAADDRRFFVLDIAGEKREPAYFDELCAQMDGGGLRGLLWHLRRVDLSRWSPRARPKTAALAEQKVRSLRPAEAFLHGLLAAGALPPEFDGEDRGDWSAGPTWVYMNTLVDALMRDARFNSRRAAEMALATALKRYVPSCRREPWGPERKIVRVFPSLAECREAFDRSFGQPLNWA